MSKSFFLPLFIFLCHLPIFLIEVHPHKNHPPKNEKIIINTIHLLQEPLFTSSITQPSCSASLPPTPSLKVPPCPPSSKKCVKKISKKSIQKSINKTLSKKSPPKKSTSTHSLKKSNENKIAKNDAVKSESEYTKYLGKITALLEQHLTLPESGKVKLVITLEPGGKVVKIRSLISESEANLNYLLKNIKEITFPTYTKKEDRIFTIVFCDE